MKPTVILIHGAYADSSSWNRVIAPLAADGHRVVAWANPLRSVASDAAALPDLVRNLDGPVVLAGHSYGGAVMTNVDPAAGDASSLTPGSTLADTLKRVPLAAGGVDTYIASDKFHHQFAADLPPEESAPMAAI
jgi:pimeloyl-ACP methyl ester carboxylesterase